jgi:hypothetical protein
MNDVTIVDQLIQDLEDGVISPEDREKLMTLMREHASVRQLYLKHIEMVALLQESAESRAGLGTIPISEDMVNQQRRKSAMASFAYSIAALLIVSIGFLVFQVSHRLDSEVKGVVMEGSDDASFTLVHSDGEAHSSKKLQIGDKLALDHGLVKFKFPSGVEAIVEGPSQLELTSESSVKMDGGMAWFRVPKAGHGFTVQTDRVNVIDLGTEFGVRFDGVDGIQVHVAKGKVRVEPILKAMAHVELTKDQAMVFDVYGRGVVADCRASMFRRKFSRSIPYLHWSFDESVDGGFAAAGTMPGISEYKAELRHILRDASQSDEKKCQINGRFGGAFSMNGEGLFAESAFPGIGGNLPRTVAMWIKHRKTGSYGNIISPYCAWGLRNIHPARGKAWKIHLNPSGEGHHLGSSFLGGNSRTKLHFDTSEWTHVVAVFTGRRLENGYPDMCYYVNGIAQEVTFSDTPVAVDTDISSSGSKPVRFGASLLASKRRPLTVDGDLDELYIFRGVLNPLQVRELMKSNWIDFFRGSQKE